MDPLHIFPSDRPENCSVFKRDKTSKIIVQFADIAMSPPTIDKVILAIGIAKGKLIDWLSLVIKLIDKRLTEVVAVWSFWTIGNSQSDATRLLIVLNIVGAEEKKIFVPFFSDGWSPDSIAGPGNILYIQDTRVFIQCTKSFEEKASRKVCFKYCGLIVFLRISS